LQSILQFLQICRYFAIKSPKKIDIVII